ncbi:MAG: hypothetical protein D6682_01300 [Zetaproteobacteria bacterium]|nr:MAG: hypothetical protein D6682_01300 [Zetaproteobacteria bacterium]
MAVTVQQSLERFVHQHYDRNRQAGHRAEHCVSLLIDYLQGWSGLLPPEWGGGEEGSQQEWERELDAQMERMLGDADRSPPADLGALTIDQLDEEHLREFIGWYLLKDMALDGRGIRNVLEMLRQWIDFAYRQRGLDRDRYHRFVAAFEECAPEGERAVVAAHALQRLVTSGALPVVGGRARSPVVSLLAVAARLGIAEEGGGCTHWMRVDDVDAESLPLILPPALHPYLREGDVVQVTLARLADGGVRLVESGALFPASSWVDALVMEQYRPVDRVEQQEQGWESSEDDLLH